jgi:extracellular factor (EF) 3-hydroxypalmitic acid methyl ester biosynthesis protein
MNRAAALFEKLSDADVDWILNTALEEQVLKGDAVIQAGTPVTALYVVLKGILAVHSPALDGERLAVIGPGGVVGDMSLLEERTPTESVVAQETTTVLVLPFSEVEAKSHKDPHFAARLYRGMAKSLSQRLRRTNSRLAVQAPAATGAAGQDNAAMVRVSAALEELEGLIHAANEAALKNRDVVPDEMQAALVGRFDGLYPLLEEAAGDASTEPEEMREKIGLQAQKHLLPYILLTRTAERLYGKPRGYPGDFMTLEMIYQNAPRGTSRIGAALDRCFLQAPFAAAVRERRTLMARELAALAGKSAEPLRVTALACGPGQEVFDAFEMLGDPERMKATLVDFDPQALALAAEKRERAKLRERVDMVGINPVYLALGRAELEVEPQDVIYALGMTDYFDDGLFIKLLDLVHGLLKPGGRVILGNFHTGNPSKAFMDHVLEWRLVHRREEDMNRLFGASRFEAPASASRYAADGLVIVGECEK